MSIKINVGYPSNKLLQSKEYGFIGMSLQNGVADTIEGDKLVQIAKGTNIITTENNIKPNLKMKVKVK